MDDIVKAAMAKWPNVPDVYGWLSLTRRGQWKIKGDAVENLAIRQFIGRNYASDSHGNWFFQNGPQRVFVQLELTPIIYRLDDGGRLIAHTGQVPHELRRVLVDDCGSLYFETEVGAGALDDRDALAASDRMVDQSGNRLEQWPAPAGAARFMAEGFNTPSAMSWLIEQIVASRVSETFAFVREPRPPEVSA